MPILDIIATTCCPTGGGGVGGFTVAGNAGPNQAIAAGDTLSILGSGLLTSTTSATDNVTITLIPGANGQILQTVAGVPTWVDLTSVGGPATPGKAFTVNGDLNVTGVIDPTKIIFSTQTPSSYDPTILNQYQIDYTDRDLMFLNNLGNVLNFKQNRDLQAINYPNTRNDGVPVNVLYTDAVGNVLSAPVTSLPGGGGGTMNSFIIAGQSGIPQTITDGNTLSILPVDASVVTAASAVDILRVGVQISSSPGNALSLNLDGLFAASGGGGGMNSFNVAGNAGVSQTITDTNTLSILGTGLIQTTAAATDNLNIALQAGANGDVLQTVAGDPTWVSASTVVAASQTPITVIDTQSVNLTSSGVAGHTIQADVNISAAPGNALTLNVDGLFAATGGGGSMNTFDIADNFANVQTISNANVVTFNSSSLIEAIVSPTDTVTHSILPGNDGDLVQTVAGVPSWVTPGSVVTGSQTPVTVIDTSTVNLTSSGVSGHNLQADVNISAAIGNILVANVDGLFVPASGGGMTSFTLAGQSGIPQTINDGNTLSILPLDASIVTSAAATDTLRVGVQISPAVDNALSLNVDGLYVPGGGLGIPEGRIRYVTANYTATLDDDVIISQPGASEIAITLPPHTTAYSPTSPTTGIGKRILVIHRPTGVGKTRVRPDPVFVFINETDRLVEINSSLDCLCISNLGAPESAWNIKRYNLPNLGSTGQGITNLSVPPAVPAVYVWNRRLGGDIGIDFPPGTEPSSITIDLGIGGNPPAAGNFDYPGQEVNIHIGRVGPCPVLITFGTASINGGLVAGIQTVVPGDKKHVGLKASFSGSIPNCWLVQGDLV
jgi:hypothetical protein